MDSRKIDENGQTVFENPNAGGASPWFNPLGKFGNWFSRFFATKAQPYMATQANPTPTEMHPLAGDTFVTDDVIKSSGIPEFGVTRNIKLPEMELNRKNRYSQFEAMDDYPEIGSAYDIYADDCTQKDTRGKRWRILSESKIVIEEIENLFETIKLDRYIWDIVRNIVKYGDCFMEEIVDLNNPKVGIQRIKILNPNYILRVENEYGYLTDFLQEIPEKKTTDWKSFGYQSHAMNQSKYIVLDKNQITHFRLNTSDPKFYPYGKAIGANAIRVFRSLKLMEDAMLVYRLSRAPERRVFYINTGSLPTNKVEAYIDKIQRKFKKEKFYDARTGNVDEKFNPLSFDEDFYVPHRGDQNTKIEVLPGAQNLGEVDDVKYFRDKLLACLKIPKDYVVEHDKSPERKANLSQLDVKFARVIMRVQHDTEIGLETIARRHLAIKGYPVQLINKLRINLPDPSDMYTKRKLDVDEQKARVVQAVKGLMIFPTEYIYKEYYDLTDSEIEDIKGKLEKEAAENPQAAMGGMGGGMPPPGGMMPPGGAPPGEEQNPNGMESEENVPPTEGPQESMFILNKRKTQALLEGNSQKSKILTRILKKYSK